MTKICGIYKITNKINGKCYIGQSNDIHRRWKQELAPNAKLNPHLARAFEKYGIDNFEFEIIEEPATADCRRRSGRTACPQRRYP